MTAWTQADHGHYLFYTMRISFLVLLFVALLLPDLVSAQEAPPTILSTTVSHRDWEISGLGNVRFGRVAVVESSEGTHLELRRLLEVEPSLPPLRMEGRIPEFRGNTLVVSDFAVGNRTPLGGYFGTFQRAPSSAHAIVGRMSYERRALELTCHHESPGFCGLWVQLYDFDASREARAYLDARDFSTLSFWIRGRVGGEGVLLKVADAEWERREDALPIGDVTSFLASGRVSTEWQQVVVPMDRFPDRVRYGLLAQIAFEILTPGATTVEIGPMAFSLAPNPLPPLPGTVPENQASAFGHKATWVWNTLDLLHAPEELASLAGFLEDEGFDKVFLQLPGIPGQPSELGELGVDVGSMRPVVAAFTSRGMQVYALDGYARYALPEYHAVVLSTIDHVAAYNKEVLPQERFYGVRYDIEPYILPEFHGPNRSRLLTGLLQLTAMSVEDAHAAGLVYGVDIPFWYDALSEESNEAITVEFGGVEKPMSEHIIDLVDDVSIMDYRTTAHGADGTIRHGTGELEYADKTGKPVFIGLETFELPDEVLLDFRGEAGVGLPKAAPSGPVVVLGFTRDSIRAGLLPEAATLSEAQAAIQGWMAQHQLSPEDLRWWPVSKRVEVPASKITFADHDAHLLEQVMRATAEEFQRFESFAGFAIHFAQTYRALVGR